MQSPDGDLIDCVPTHLQPSLDHPELIGQKPVVSFSMKLYDFGVFFVYVEDYD